MILFLMGKKHSTHPDDHYLSYVLAQRVDAEAPYKVREFVVWLKNSTLKGNGCNNGHYFESIQDAIDFFLTVGEPACYKVCPNCGSKGCKHEV